MSGSEFFLAGVGHHPRHRHAGFVRHEQSPELEAASNNIPSHLHPSLEHLLPHCCLTGQTDLMESLSGPALSSVIKIGLLLLQSSELVKPLLETQIFPEVNTAQQLGVDSPVGPQQTEGRRGVEEHRDPLQTV